MKNFDITLYGILDPEHCLDRDLAELAVTAANNGATLLQYRDKINGTRHMVAAVTSILDALGDSEVKVIVNDRVDVALAAGAHGVHLGPSDMDAGRARRIAGDDLIIGISVKTPEGAESIPCHLVDYAFIGGVHETTSKDNPAAFGLDGWRERAERIRESAPRLPVGAIAGLTPGNCAEVVQAGADGIAAISALFEAEDVGAATQAFRRAIEEARESNGQNL
ncbi:thiamine phosphate synthase [Salaquimonas pukyongi]|uniref:thiamine phosphate synthase n=1 Tax=Salaquimonas pukyongi TaxID=2712698 RepID=UPI00096BA65D|nr:thiamine phosphate synthase [Salaquimonas pukyongi]